jgi:hypothetical protein
LSRITDMDRRERKLAEAQEVDGAIAADRTELKSF